MYSRIQLLRKAFQFKKEYLTLHIAERTLLIDECIERLHGPGLAWFSEQKILHDDPTDVMRKGEVVSADRWKTFYELVLNNETFQNVVLEFVC